MNKVIALALAISLATAPAFAATTKVVPMSATVGAILDLTGTVYQGDVADNVIVTAANFGTLINGGGTLVGDKFFTVLLGAVTSGRKYSVTSTAAPLTSGPNTLAPTNSIITPHMKGGSLPAGAILGTRSSWVATNKVIYTSATAGSGRQFATALAITNDPAQGASAPYITTDQPAGSYTSTITYTLALVA